MNMSTTVVHSPARLLELFIDRFDGRNRSLIRAARRCLRRRLAGAHELVYDNYAFLVIGYGPTVEGGGPDRRGRGAVDGAAAGARQGDARHPFGVGAAAATTEDGCSPVSGCCVRTVSDD